MEKLDARKRYTQKMLKASLLRLMEEKPESRITVRELCELAQISRATFYSHYCDGYALLEDIENDLLREFAASMNQVRLFDAAALVEAMYSIIERNEPACRVLILKNTDSSVIQRMIAMARESALDCWRREFPGTAEAELDMMYTLLSNGMLRVITEGYGVYPRAQVVGFAGRVVSASLSLFKTLPGARETRSRLQ